MSECPQCSRCGFPEDYAPEKCPRCGMMTATRDHNTMNCRNCEMCWPLDFVENRMVTPLPPAPLDDEEELAVFEAMQTGDKEAAARHAARLVREQYGKRIAEMQTDYADLKAERDRLTAENQRLVEDIKLMSAPHESVGAIILALRAERDRLAALLREAQAEIRCRWTVPNRCYATGRTPPCEACDLRNKIDAALRGEGGYRE